MLGISVAGMGKRDANVSLSQLEVMETNKCFGSSADGRVVSEAHLLITGLEESHSLEITLLAEDFLQLLFGDTRGEVGEVELC